VERIEGGWSVMEAAAAAGISDRTARRWLRRWREEGSGGLLDRSSAPRRIPHKTPRARVAEIVRLRRLRMTAASIAVALGMALSTVSAVLRRVGLGKRSRLEPPEPANRYERRRPGELIHIDVKKLGRILKPGHRVTGKRINARNTYTPDGRRIGDAGWESLHVCVDDHSRLAYAEVLTDEKATSAAGFLRRAVAFFATHGVNVERVMTDNGSPYPLAAARPGLPRARAAPPAHPALPAAHQRQGRALHPDAATRMGLRTPLPHQRRAHSSPPTLAQPLQLHPTTRRPRPQTARHPPDEPS
jgi:transposase